MTLPDPDPSWDYSQLYQHLSFAKSALDRTIVTISKEEFATDATDSVLIELLETLQGEALKAFPPTRGKTDGAKCDRSSQITIKLNLLPIKLNWYPKNAKTPTVIGVKAILI